MFTLLIPSPTVADGNGNEFRNQSGHNIITTRLSSVLFGLFSSVALSFTNDLEDVSLLSLTTWPNSCARLSTVGFILILLICYAI